MKTLSAVCAVALTIGLATDTRADALAVGLDLGTPGGALNAHGGGYIVDDSGLVNMMYVVADSGVFYELLDVIGLGYVDAADVAPGVMRPQFLSLSLGAGVASDVLAVGVGAGFGLGEFYEPREGGSLGRGAVDGQVEAMLGVILPGVMIQAVPYWGGTALRNEQIGKIGVDVRAYVALAFLEGLVFYGRYGYVEHTRWDDRTDALTDTFDTHLMNFGIGFGGVDAGG